ncbi:hypothetical protein HGRIS_012063 [Hohenbuehelia grisea]|uniref:Uncharacterized protein n=1 Tax=Hohenbuehelia grisea TaxID=104357 RepID=A0ABR3IR60_9AGAR
MQEEKSAVYDFGVALLRLLNYEGDNTMIRQRKEMSFMMGGKKVDAEADLTIVDDNYCYLVVQENKRIGSPDDPKAQLIAESIAAFHLNAIRRRYEGNLPPLERQVIPGITMVGTSPIFYRTTVTRSLLNNLSSLQYPSEETVVLRVGMTTVENRRIVLQCFEAFKPLLVCGRLC